MCVCVCVCVIYIYARMYVCIYCIYIYVYVYTYVMYTRVCVLERRHQVDASAVAIDAGAHIAPLADLLGIERADAAHHRDLARHRFVSLYVCMYVRIHINDERASAASACACSRARAERMRDK
jgi:hypothetical protein